jgi:hypothetical protein
MLYQNIIFTGFALTTTVQAAVNFYGPDRDQGDYVTCQFKDFLDEDVSAFLELFYPAQMIDDSNDFVFEEPLTCAHLLSHDIQATCQDAGGNTTCIPFRKKICLDLSGRPTLCLSLPSAKRSVLHRSIGRRTTAPVKKPDSELEYNRRRSVGHALERRDGAKCNDFSNECRNEYQSTNGYCKSGYIHQTFDVDGSTGDVWRSKECTAEEEATCDSQAYTSAKQDCETNNNVNSCRKALLNCHSNQVKIDQSLCNLGNLGFYGDVCKSLELKGVMYKDGYCSIIEADDIKVRAYITEHSNPDGDDDDDD